MQSLKRSKLLILVPILFLQGCVTSSYKIKQDNGRAELTVTPDRVILECESLTDYSGDIKEAHGFMMHVLDDKNTALTVTQTNVLGKEDCFAMLYEIEKILKNGKQIFIGGFGDMRDPRTQEELTYSFPSLGKFHYNGRVLQLGVVWNESGQCFNSQTGKQKPCPRNEFPIKN